MDKLSPTPKEAEEFRAKPMEFSDIDPKNLVVQTGSNAGATEKNLAHDAAQDMLDAYDGNVPDVLQSNNAIGTYEEAQIRERATGLIMDASSEKQNELGFTAAKGFFDEQEARLAERPDNQADDMIARIMATDHTKPKTE